MPEQAPRTSRTLPLRPRPVWRRRLARFWLTYQWPIIIAVWVCSMVLGYVGFWKYFQQFPTEKPHAWGDLIYYTMQLVPMISGALPHVVPFELEVARHVLPIVEGYTGIVALVIVFSSEVKRLRLRTLRDHLIVCGLGSKGRYLARQLREMGLPTVAVERDPGNPAIEESRDEGVIVLTGDASDERLLARAGLARARMLVAVCDDDTNARVVAAVRHLVRAGRRSPLACSVHIVEPWLYELLSQQELEPEQAGILRLDLFNVFDLGARAMLAQHGPAAGESAGPEHILVAGLGGLGRSVVVWAARNWHPRFRATGERLRISVVDSDARAWIDALCAHYPRLASVCALVAHDVSVDSGEFQRGAFLFDDEGRSDVSVAFVCHDDDQTSVAAGLSLAHSLREQPTRVVGRVRDGAGLAVLLPEAGGGDPRLAAFPLYERTCTPELVLGGMHESLARMIHDEYVRHQTSRGETAAINPSLRPWDELPLELQEASRTQADHIGVKLAAAGCGLEPMTDWDADLFAFTREEVERLSVMEHERWVDDHARAGWTQATGAKNVAKKTHPSMVPWDDLSEPEREKDREAVRSLPVFLARTGFQVYRLAAATAG